jgi:predicted nucleic acid-binding Zn ribbon protein
MTSGPLTKRAWSAPATSRTADPAGQALMADCNCRVASPDIGASIAHTWRGRVGSRTVLRSCA